MKFTKYILALFLSFFTMLCFSQSQTNELAEKQATVKWVMKQGGKGLSQQRAHQIVGIAYATAKRYRVSPKRVLAIMHVESRFKQYAKSGMGAKGLMQVMDNIHRKKFKGRSPYDVAASIDVGTQVYVEYLGITKNHNRALMRYVGGPDRKYVRNVNAAQYDLERHTSPAQTTVAPIRRSTEVVYYIALK
jgi:soluble lytic murein transglycosylase-like protein